MASLLRQIVAAPRARHPEASLDLCYVTPNIIATSGPSGTYPQRAYRNPLDALVKFLDAKHGDRWMIWEFRAEGTGYPDEAVYGRVRHYPWPDHHPPPFRLLPLIVAGMRNWVRGEEGGKKEKEGEENAGTDGERVIVVHCKAGKGRSGTVSCSYLIAEEGWTVEDALQRFTERRMRPGFGAGVSIPSQLRWVGYVDRWTKGGKVYVERQLEVLEVHVWELRDGVKISIEGFVDDGRTIKTFHTFKKSERTIVRGNDVGWQGGGFADVVAEAMRMNSSSKGQKSAATFKSAGTGTSSGSANTERTEDDAEAGGGDVIFRPSTRVVLRTNDINIDFERRNKAAYGWTMVTSVAHVWFNAFFEGRGPEQNGRADDSGVFEIEWDKMDGIKGSSRKGTRAFDKMAVVWRALDEQQGATPVVIHEPKVGEEVPDTQPADWKGVRESSPGVGKELGLRVASPGSRDISRASSADSRRGDEGDPTSDSDEVLEGTRPHGPHGEETVIPPDGILPTSRELPQRTHEASDSSDEVAELTSASQPELIDRDQQLSAAETAIRISNISTGDLPGGRPEEEMRTASEHVLGHLKQTKETNSSS